MAWCLERMSWCLEGVNLPAGPLSTERQQAIQIIGSLLRTLIRPDMAGLQTVSDGQQIHTGKRSLAVPTVRNPPGPRKGGNPLYHSCLEPPTGTSSSDFHRNVPDGARDRAPQIRALGQDFLPGTHAVELRAR